jgi:membrane protease subunit HflK
VNPTVTERRLYLDTMSDVFGRMNKVLVDPGLGGSGGSGVVPYLPLDQLVPKAPRIPEAAPSAQAAPANTQTQVTPAPDANTGASQ